MSVTVSDITAMAELIKQKLGNQLPYTVAVSGFAGSSKSTVSRKLAESLD